MLMTPTLLVSIQTTRMNISIKDAIILITLNRIPGEHFVPASPSSASYSSTGSFCRTRTARTRSKRMHRESCLRPTMTTIMDMDVHLIRILTHTTTDMNAPLIAKKRTNLTIKTIPAVMDTGSDSTTTQAAPTRSTWNNLRRRMP